MIVRHLFLFGILAVALGSAILDAQTMQNRPVTLDRASELPANTEYAVLGGGCFWCIEAVFARIEGVLRVTSGFAGGHKANPTYREVITGETGHAEVTQIAYDPAHIDYSQLLDVFWLAHDPTTPNRQGPDVGTQYRSIILYTNDAQKEAAESSVRKAASQFEDPIVTEVKPLDTFYPAEDYHQDYFENNSRQPYCRFVIVPKLQKVEGRLRDTP